MRQTPRDFLKRPQRLADRFDGEMEECTTGKSSLSYSQCSLAAFTQNHEHWMMGHAFKCIAQMIEN